MAAASPVTRIVAGFYVAPQHDDGAALPPPPFATLDHIMMERP
jgi:hypothetical protein